MWSQSLDVNIQFVSDVTEVKRVFVCVIPSVSSSSSSVQGSLSSQVSVVDVGSVHQQELTGQQ